jgi:hypothetical protein
VNCPVCTVKGNPLDIPGGGTVAFKGTVSVEANGILRANTTGSVDGQGYPNATDASKHTTIIVSSTSSTAFSTSSNSSSVFLAQTTVYNGGGFSLQSSNGIHWTGGARADGTLGGLMYWSESTQPFSIQGGPTIQANGIVFHGNGQLTGGGGGLIDLTRVQAWVGTVSLSGKATVRISADPDVAPGASAPGTRLIR